MKCDVAIIGDFRFPGGTSTSIAHEIRTLRQGGYSVGLVPVRAPILKRERPIHPLIQAAIDRGDARLMADGGAVEARLGLFENPQVFTALPSRLPRLSLGEKLLVVHHPALDGRGVPWYDPAVVQGVCEAIGGDGLRWAPISPVCRANLRQAKLPFPLLDEDWLNIIFVEDWQSERSHPAGARPVIGRHSPVWQPRVRRAPARRPPRRAVGAGLRIAVARPARRGGLRRARAGDLRSGGSRRARPTCRRSRAGRARRGGS